MQTKPKFELKDIVKVPDGRVGKIFSIEWGKSRNSHFTSSKLKICDEWVYKVTFSDNFVGDWEEFKESDLQSVFNTSDMMKK